MTSSPQEPFRLAAVHGSVSGALLSRHAKVAGTLVAAQRDVLVVSSLVDPVPAARQAVLGRGIRFRMLVPDHVRTTAGPARRLGRLARQGVLIRTMPDVPLEALVVDGTLAILPGEDTHDVAVLRLPSVVAAITELAERLWPIAVPFTGSDPPEAVELSDRDRELLALLCEGRTDESAAAALGVSVRTVRRMVSSLMNRLGARSRFQAGVKAADRGWLAEEAHR
ncbi:response regulator transcription factor [Amycolatopsis sp. 195334CR]|uniref:response regulator transcription factor n=1 Tax=Amycolatopsis sp. 195334CR TaxID=2814588 RepID=UPI001A8E4F36|nr:helix-turn-helix transcriptional regulator [Amycolatopsis sp. 195334CR]MBN6039075.1 helix-turn-helix transcriptional regulator [Amycolatopsis sp. 195334CR]